MSKGDAPKQFISGRIVGGYSLHVSHDHSKAVGRRCTGGAERCGHGRVVDCCGVADDMDILECDVCGRQWYEACSFDEDMS